MCKDYKGCGEEEERVVTVLGVMGVAS